MIESAKRIAVRVLDALGELEWLPIFIARLSVGLEFFESGRGKIFKLDELGNYFADLGIPLPHLNALVVSWTELVAGFCLILGFLSRIVALPLAIIMMVAIFTAHIQKVKTVGDFFYLPEVLLLVLLVWLVFSGPGKLSIDHLIARRLEYKRG
jgi:putative oxidoreductase